MQGRNKAGGIVDRRFGENDPTMTPEDRMLERFTREKQKRVRGGELFNLEDDDDGDDDGPLTHFGQSLGGLRPIGQGLHDDFDGGAQGLLDDSDEDIDGDDDDESNPQRLARKKRTLEDSDAGREDGGEGPVRKKSKAEVMKEVIAKSKLHKYERQKLKEDDEDEREKLDAELGDLWALLGARQPSATGKTTGANSEPLGGGGDESGKDGKLAVAPTAGDAEEGKPEKEYDQAVRLMMFDKRSKPANRTKTEEEKAAEESERLKKLEEDRLRRMRGEESDQEEQIAAQEDPGDLAEERVTDAAAYGLGDGIPVGAVSQAIADENPDALLEGDYVASSDDYVDVDDEGMVDGDAEFSDDDDDEDSGGSAGMRDAAADSDEEDFLAGVLPPSETAVRGARAGGAEAGRNEKLAFTFPCPQTHKEMLEIVKDTAVEDAPTIVQRIRVLHHAKLAAENKAKLQVGVKIPRAG